MSEQENIMLGESSSNDTSEDMDDYSDSVDYSAEMSNDSEYDEAVTEELPVEDNTKSEEQPATEDDEVDYERLMEEDLRQLKAEFSELGNAKSITELSNPLRYAALRDLGLTPREAYLATQDRRPRIDNRSHLASAVARRAAMPTSAMTPREMRQARELFSDMSDAEINALYQRVTK